MNKIYKCDSCNNVYSYRQSLWKHKQNCNNKRIRASTVSYPDVEKRKTFIDSIITKDGGLGTDKVQIQQPRNYGTVTTIFPDKRQKPVDSLHSTTLNPKILALVDAIVNEDESTISKKNRRFNDIKRSR